MNPSGQPQPGQQNNTPPTPPPRPGPFPADPNPYGQPQQYRTTGAPQAAQFGQPYAQAYGQAAPPPPADLQPAAPAQYSADYLDQIAPGPSGPRLLGGNFTWILVGLAILFMFAVGIIALSSGNNNTATAQTTYMRVDNLINITNNYKRFLKSSSLTTTNTNFKIFLTGAKTNLVDPLAKNGVVTEKLDKEAKAKEQAIAGALTAKLEDARLNAILDRVYAREMAFQTQQLLDNYTKMSKNASPDIANNAKKAIPNLQPLQKAFEDFNDTED